MRFSLSTLIHALKQRLGLKPRDRDAFVPMPKDVEQRVRQQLVDEIRVSQPAAGWLQTLRTRARFPIAATLAILIMLSGSAGAAYADQSTPQDPLFFFDRLFEEIHLFLTRSPEARLNLQITFAKERLLELEELAGDDEDETNQSTVDDAETEDTEDADTTESDDTDEESGDTDEESEDVNASEDGDSGARSTICHATGSDVNPFVTLTIAATAPENEGHNGHTDDIIPAPEDGCPQGNTVTIDTAAFLESLGEVEKAIVRTKKNATEIRVRTDGPLSQEQLDVLFAEIARLTNEQQDVIKKIQLKVRDNDFRFRLKTFTHGPDNNEQEDVDDDNNEEEEGEEEEDNDDEEEDEEDDD